MILIKNTGYIGKEDTMGLIILIVVIVALIFVNVRIVPQEYAYVIELLGKYKETWQAGIHVKIPLVERIGKKVTLKEQVLDFPPQPVITKDNVSVNVDSVVFARIFDPKAYTYGAENPIAGLQNLSATTLRNIIGEMELDQTLISRSEINAQMTQVLDEATDAWGIKVTRVELKNITPPHEIEEVMTKQMRAERERRQTVLEAQAHQEAVVSRAKGDKDAKVLAAEAEKEARIRVAEGEAESVRLVYEAEAKGLQMLRDAAPNQAVLNLKALESLKEVADGRATKIYMPSDIANVVTSLGILGESLGIGDAVDIDISDQAKRPVSDPCLSDSTSREGVIAAETTESIMDDVENQDKYFDN